MGYHGVLQYLPLFLSVKIVPRKMMEKDEEDYY